MLALSLSDNLMIEAFEIELVSGTGLLIIGSFVKKFIFFSYSETIPGHIYMIKKS